MLVKVAFLWDKLRIFSVLVIIQRLFLFLLQAFLILFPFFFILPGLLVAGLSLAAGRHDTRRSS